MKRREMFQLAALSAMPMFAGAAKLPNSVMDVSKAKLSKEAFGDLRIYFDGADRSVEVDDGRQPAAEGGDDPASAAHAS